MQLELSQLSTYVHSDGKLFKKGVIYTFSDEEGEKMLRAVGDNGVSFFRVPRPQVGRPTPVDAANLQDVRKSSLAADPMDYDVQQAALAEAAKTAAAGGQPSAPVNTLRPAENAPAPTTTHTGDSGARAKKVFGKKAYKLKPGPTGEMDTAEISPEQVEAAQESGDVTKGEDGVTV